MTMYLSICNCLVLYSFTLLPHNAVALNRINCIMGSTKETLCDTGSLHDEMNNTVAQFQWTLRKGSTPTFNTGPDVDRTTRRTEGYYLFIEATDRLPNDKARVYTSTLEPGSYSVQFYYHASGDGVGGLDVYTRSQDSEFSRPVWRYSKAFNSSINTWTMVQVIVNQAKSFAVLFDGWRGINSFGDLAIDDILIRRLGNADSETKPTAFGLPISCEFEENEPSCHLVTPYIASQFNWQIWNGTRGTPNTGPARGHTPERSNPGHWLLMDTTAATAPKDRMRAVIRTRRFWTAPCGCFYLEFWYHAYGSDLGRLEVRLEGYDSPLLDITPSSADMWVHMKRTFYAAEPTELLFVGYSADSSYGDIALDDISVENCDECGALNRINCIMGSTKETLCDTGSLHDEMNNTIAQFQWTLRKGSTPTLNTGPDTDRTTLRTEGYYLFIEATDRLPNDKARVYTTTLEPGSYSIQFYYHASGDGVGGLDVYTRSQGSQFSRPVWRYSKAFNGSVNTWTMVQVIVNQAKSFEVLFDGWRGINSFGDLAIDDILIRRLGNADSETKPSAFGLPISCEFEENEPTCHLVTPYIASQFEWQKWSGTRGTPNTGPTRGHTLRRSNPGHWLLMDTTAATAPKDRMRAVIRTRKFWTAPCGCFYLDFWYHAYGSDLGWLEVRLEGYDSPLLNITPSSADVWVHMRRTFYAAEPTELLFVGYSADSSYGDMALDDISVENCDECGVTTTITPTTTTTTPTTTTTAPTTTTTTPTPTTPVPTTTTAMPTTQTTSPTTQTTTPTTSTPSTPTSTPTPTTPEPTTTTTTATTAMSTTSTIPPSTTPHAMGHQDCNFDISFCKFEQPTADGALKWKHVGKDVTRVPSSDTIGNGMFAFVNSDDVATTNVAQLMTNSFIYNPNTCHMVRFRHSISAGTTGTLRVWLLTEEKKVVKQLWHSSTVTNGWAPVITVHFRYSGKLILKFEAKRTTTTGGSDFALDDIGVPVIDCTTVPMYPPSNDSVAIENSAGDKTGITGRSGVIQSPNYPLMYQNDVKHTWVITVKDDSTIAFTVTDLRTEPSADVIRVTDDSTGKVLFSLSGSILPTEVPKSTGNVVTVTFTSDANTRLEGFSMNWRRVDVVTTTVNVPSTRAPYGFFVCEFETEDACADNLDIMNSTDYEWKWIKGKPVDSSNTGPEGDATGSANSGYLFLNSAALVNDEDGSFMVGPFFDNRGTHKLRFSYYANGDNLGSLSATVLPQALRRRRDTVSPKVLWSSSNVVSNKWRDQTVEFEQEGSFLVKITGKRKLTNGLFRGGDLAIDRLSVSAYDRPVATVAPGLVNGGIISLTGSRGRILSPFYPDPYVKESASTYVWEIHVVQGLAINVFFEDFQTESGFDILTFKDQINDKTTEYSGDKKPSPPIYKSTGNKLRIQFTADAKVFGRGFYLTWYVEEPVVVVVTQKPEVPVTVAGTTVIATLPDAGAQVNTGEVKWEWYVILFFAIMIAAVIVIIVIVVILCIRKRNAEKNKIATSQEHLANGEPQLVEAGKDYTPQGIYGNYYDRPAPSYYDNGSVGGQTATTALNNSGRFDHMIQYDAANTVTNPEKKRHKIHLDQDGQIVRKKKSKKSKRTLDPIRGSLSLSQPSGLIAVPDGQGNTNTEAYVCCQHRDNPPTSDV